MDDADLGAVRKRAAETALACASTRATYPCAFRVDGSGIRDDEHRFVGSLSQRNLMTWFVFAWKELPAMADLADDLVDEIDRLRSALTAILAMPASNAHGIAAAALKEPELEANVAAGECRRCGAVGVPLWRARLQDGSGLECAGCRS